MSKHMFHPKCPAAPHTNFSPLVVSTQVYLRLEEAAQAEEVCNLLSVSGDGKFCFSKHLKSINIIYNQLHI